MLLISTRDEGAVEVVKLSPRVSNEGSPKRPDQGEEEETGEPHQTLKTGPQSGVYNTRVFSVRAVPETVEQTPCHQ